PTHDDSESTESIKIRFTHDLSGLLEVEVTVDTTGEKRQLLIERSGSSDADALASAATALAALKTHPRDLLPNRWLLDRATKLVEMLVGDERDALDSELGSFEADLERGHPEHIAYAAKGLRQSIDNLIRKNDIRLD
ncbi:MAG: molecular chaperone HscC, partial [Myxococcota bacterium]